MKILIADDHALFRDGLAMFMEQFDKDIIVFQTTSENEGTGNSIYALKLLNFIFFCVQIERKVFFLVNIHFSRNNHLFANSENRKIFLFAIVHGNKYIHFLLADFGI